MEAVDAVRSLLEGPDGERDVGDGEMARARSSMTPPSSASHAKELLDAGTISQAEFDAIKAKTLSP